MQVKILDPRATLPLQGTPLSAGYDLVACIDSPITLRYGDKAKLIPTGLAMFSNRADIAGIILPRSGLGHKQGLVLGNTLGLIDGDYQNQWFISAWNRGNGGEWNILHGGIYFPDIVINPGDKIAQCIFVPVLHPKFMIVTDFDTTTQRGQGGFGSTS